MPSIKARSGRSLVVAMLATSLLVASAVGQVEPLDQGVITLTEARSGHTATLLPDDYVLLAGGFDGETELATVEVVDPIGMNVEELGSLAVARTEHTATLLPDERILITGGRAGDASLADAEILDPLSGLSEPIGSMNEARAGHDAVLLDDGRVLLVGGIDGDSPVVSAELFDPSAGTFTKAAAPRAIHRGATSTLLADGRVLLAGEVVKAKKKTRKTKKSKQATSTSPIEIYDPVGDKWKVVQKATTDLSATTATRLADGRVLLAGGFEDALPSGATWLYDPEGGDLTAVGGLSRPRTDHSATLLPDGSVLILGGPIVTAVEVIDPGSLTSGVIADTGTPRADHTTTLLGDGRVLVAGGRFAALALDDLLVYDTADQSLTELGAAPLPDMPGPVQPEPGSLTRSEIREALGPPDAFAIFYYDELDDDGTVRDTRLERWDYYGDSVSYTFLDGGVLSEDTIELVVEQVQAAPYDPDQFHAYMDLDEVVAVAGLEEYLGGAVDEAVDNGAVYFADRLAWGMKDGELRYIEAPALMAEAGVD
jgi:hypothetical protein